MSITFDAASSAGGNAAGQSSLSWSHTVGAGASLLLVGSGNIVNTSTTPRSISTATFGGVALTQLTFIANGNNNRIECWYLKSPTPGTATIALTYSGNTHCAGGGVSLYGTDATSPFGTAATNTGSSTTTTVSLTAADLTLDVLGLANGNIITVTPGASQTQRVNVTSDTGALANTQIFGMSTKSAASSMSWTQHGSTTAWAMLGIPIVAAAGATVLPRGVHVINRAAIQRRSRW